MVKRLLAIFLTAIILSSCTFVPKSKLETEPNIPGKHGEKLLETDPATETPDCSLVDPVPTESGVDTSDVETEPIDSESIETEPVETQPIETDAKTEIPSVDIPKADSFEDAVMSFSEILYKTITDSAVEPKNIIFSPVSVLYALSLTGNGAVGETYDEFSNIFGGIEPKVLNESLRALNEALAATEKSKVKVGNAIWVNGREGDSSLNDNYVDMAKRYYSARVEELPFDDTAKQMMNEWVSEMTDGMIGEAVSQLNPNLVMLLMNTVMFDGKWETAFEEKYTKEGVFHNYDGTESLAYFMQNHAGDNYRELDGAIAISKYYLDKYKFIAVLPEGDIDEYISTMDISDIIQKMRSFDNYDLHLVLPKFEYDYSVGLNSTLQALGLNKAFTGDAEFNGMFDDEGRSAFISSVKQDAKIIMSESGTKAAAYTEVDMVESVPISVEARFDKPFFYMIIDENGIPLFLGTIYDFKEEGMAGDAPKVDDLDDSKEEDSKELIDETVRIPEDELADVFEDSVAEFSDKLYEQIIADNDKKDNTVVSPLSVIYALSLIANGAEGETLRELEAALGEIPIDQLNEYLKALTDKLTSYKNTNVVVGNSTWTNSKKFILSGEFGEIADKYYYAEAESLPFDKAAVNRINSWVSDKTDGMIEGILSELDPNALMVLVNTILFDGKWETEYSDNDIKDGVFHNYDGTTSDVEYLFSKETGAYFTVDGAVGFSKSYNDGFKFTAVLPADIDKFLSNLDVNRIIKAEEKARGNVKVYIPKFEYDYGADLTDMLKNMGIKSAMAPDKAEFYGLSADGKTNAFIGSVIQKAKIILNEKGTKAAAATAVATYGTTAVPKEDPVIRLDKPFFYMILDEDGIPLFMGTIYNMK